MAHFSAEQLEFDRLLHVIAGASHSDVSRSAVLGIGPLPGRDDILKRQQQVREIMRMSQEAGPLRLFPFQDITPLIPKTRPEGALLDARELAAFIPVLSIAAGISAQIRGRNDLPSLLLLAGSLTGCPDLLKQLTRSVNAEGEILDTASVMLADIRDRIRKLEGRIRKRLEDIVRDKEVSVFLQDDFVTKRSGRWVIPVRMDSKGQVSGVVHDVSNSGETAFMEPLDIINLANELENLVAEQKAEEIRILRALTAKVRDYSFVIDAEFRTITYLDMLNCIAVFAEGQRMTVPVIGDPGSVHIVRGRHPLLSLALQRAGRGDRIVPLNVSLGGEDTVMVITGSNAGGKTIAIKTVGLIMLMALCGMPVPADESSRFPIIRNLLVDIGDDQSIENSLSTFSGHIENITRILENSGPDSLVLIDELGTGTDPDEGGALACAILKELRNRGAMVFATTHLGDIKGFVQRTEGMLNASMEFDQKTLMPRYLLRVGEPGQSHALETARRYGLPDRIIVSAKSLLSSNKIEFDNLVSDLNLKRQIHEKAIADAEQQQALFQEKVRKLEEERNAQELKYKGMLSDAYARAAEVVQETKQQMNALLEELRQKERAEGREILRQVRQRQEEIEGKRREYALPGEEAVSIDTISEGDHVRMKSLGKDAVVIKVHREQNRLKVGYGGKEIELPVSEVGLSLSMPGKPPRGEVTAPQTADLPVLRLNLIGQRVDDALSELEPFLNHASLSGVPEVSVIHGFGTGALSRAVRDYLKGHPLVKAFRKGEQSEGGGGVTVVTMR